jgi:hypothetical protein
MLSKKGKRYIPRIFNILMNAYPTIRPDAAPRWGMQDNESGMSSV